jgi:hypothetical protein
MKLTRQKDSFALELEASTPRSASLRLRRVVMLQVSNEIMSQAQFVEQPPELRTIYARWKERPSLRIEY